MLTAARQRSRAAEYGEERELELRAEVVIQAGGTQISSACERTYRDAAIAMLGEERRGVPEELQPSGLDEFKICGHAGGIVRPAWSGLPRLAR